MSIVNFTIIANLLDEEALEVHNESGGKNFSSAQSKERARKS
jgi:hypothetical protein